MASGKWLILYETMPNWSHAVNISWRNEFLMAGYLVKMSALYVTYGTRKLGVPSGFLIDFCSSGCYDRFLLCCPQIHLGQFYIFKMATANHNWDILVIYFDPLHHFSNLNDNYHTNFFAICSLQEKLFIISRWLALHSE